mmetsp:Transcript_36434/g.74054  ORF Transcript_36434/g.74054 Transcript_36434/m.74054 type:complete len:174 (+) Transcript_36434:135-656(+)
MLFELIIFCSFQFHSIILLSVVDRNQSFCLNQASAHPMGNIFMGDERLFLESDCDEQLLMSIAFKATVNLEAISFVGPIGEKAPLTVKLYANASNMGFDNCESLAPTQEFQLTPADLAPDAMTTVYKVKFQRIDSLTIFIEDSNGADTTILSGLKFFGTTVIGTNMAEFKKAG